MPWTLDDVLKELENQQTTAKTSNAKSGRWTVQDVEEALKPNLEPVTIIRETGEMTFRPDIEQRLKTESPSLIDTTKMLQRTMPVTPVKTQTSEEEQWFKNRPILNFLANNPVSTFISEKIVPFTERIGSTMRRTVFGGDPYYTTGTGEYKPPDVGKVGNIAADILGTIEGYALPAGGPGSSSVLSASRKIGEKAVEKLAPKLPTILQKPLAQRVMQGMVEDVPLALYSGAVGKQKPEEILKNLALQAPFTIGGEAVLYGLGKGFRGAINRAQDIAAAGARGQQALKKLKLPKSQATAETVQSINPQRYDILDITEAVDGTYAYIKNKNTGKESFVKIADNLTSKADLPKVEAKTVEPPKVFSKADTTPLEPGTRERGFSRNIRTDMAMPDEIRQVFDEDPLIYKQISNNETLSKAQAIYNKGTAEATSDFYNSLNSKEFKPETVPLAKMLAKDAVSSGDMATARTVLSDMAVKLTEAGQFSQAAKILREADPETFLYTIDKQLKKLNEQGAKQYGKKWKDIDLLPDEIEAIRKIPQGVQHAYEAVWEQIGNRIAKELPSTGMEKFDAWRRIAMLLNPKTHIRNTLGNVIMAGMQKASDTIGAAFEKAFVPVGQRTKSVGWSLDKNIVSKVDEAWDTVKKDLLGESRWEIDNLKALGMEKRIFKNNILQRLNEASLKSLNLEDNIFTKRAYRDSLGQYMKANKLDTVTDAAQEYAKRRALEATFKQTNELASILNNLKRKKVFGTFVEGAIPFTKTPANIAMRAIEYSPAGLIKALYNKSAGKTAADVIEDLSKGLTGSAISTLGFILASIGWGRSEKGRSEKAEGILSEAGEQPYSIVTPLGSYTFDWAQPFAVPLAMGMAIAESLKRRKDGDAVIEAVWNGIKEGGDTIFNMTMLKNIKDILGGGGSVTQKIASIPISYIEQAIPTLFGQIGRTVDDVKRSTYDPNPIKQELNKIKAKAGFTKGLEPKLNVWGEEQKQGGPLQQLFSPGFAKEKNSDKVTQEMARLFKSIGETKFLPKLEDGKFTDKDIDYRLSAKQLTDFQRDMGQANYRDISAKINTPEYKMASDEQKAKFIKFIVERNYENAKKKALKQLKSGQK